MEKDRKTKEPLIKFYSPVYGPLKAITFDLVKDFNSWFEEKYNKELYIHQINTIFSEKSGMINHIVYYKEIE